MSTPEHPFARAGIGDRLRWVRADRLAAGDSLVRLSPSASLTDVLSVREILGRPAPVFNLVVSRVHAYVVGPSHLLVHNGRCRLTPEEIEADKRTLEELLAKRTRLKADGDPDSELPNLKTLIVATRKRINHQKYLADPAKREAQNQASAEHSRRRRAENPGVAAAAEREKYRSDPAYRERKNQRRTEYARNRRRTDPAYRQRYNEIQVELYHRRRAAIQRLEASRGNESSAEFQSKLQEMHELLMAPGPGETFEGAEGDLRSMIREFEDEIASGTGAGAGERTSAQWDWELAADGLREEMDEIEGSIAGIETMSEDIRAYFVEDLIKLKEKQARLAEERRIIAELDAPIDEAGVAEVVSGEALQKGIAELEALLM